MKCDNCDKDTLPTYNNRKREIEEKPIDAQDYLRVMKGDKVYFACSAKCAIAIEKRKEWKTW